MKKFNVILMMLVSLIVSGCKVYGTSFSCPDARGLNCMPVSMVDQRIDSGEIEEVEQSNCKGKNCKNKNVEIKPSIKLDKTYEAQLIRDATDAEDEAVIVGDRLYVK